MDVANPVRGQLNREMFCRPRLRLRIWSREMGCAVPPRASLPILLIHVEAKMLLNHGLLSFLPLSFPRWRPSISSTAIRHRVSPEFIRAHNCVPKAFTTESPPATGQ